MTPLKIEPCEDTQRRLRAAADPLAAFQTILAGHGGLGFFYVLSVLPPQEDGRLSARNAFLHHSFPPGWESAQGRETVIDNDPTLARLSPTVSEVLWHSVARDDALTPARRRWVATAEQLGLNCGVTLRLSDPKDRYSLSAIGLWLGRDGGDAACHDLWARKADILRRISAALDRVLRGGRAHGLVALSPRECECLAHLSRGASPATISQSLGISTKTFEKHVASAKVKLKARTRDHAVAKALLLQLLP